MQLSYAQNLEDYYLDRLFPDVLDGTYVDVGGGHPVADNVTFHAYLKGWSGLVVEPQEDLARLYAGVRPRDRVVCCLAGRVAGHVDFHVVDGMHGLSSVLPANAARARDYGAATRVVAKPVSPLSALIDAAGLSVIQALKIDVEGAEPDVLAGLDLARHRPQVILVEAVNPNNLAADVAGWEPMVLAGDYRFAFFDNLNRYYVAAECADLAVRFPAAPAAWETVGHLWDWGRAAERPAHPDRRLADTLVAGLFAELPRLVAEQPELFRALLARGLEAVATPDRPGPQLPDLVGFSEPSRGPAVGDLDALMRSDAFRAALGRIACMYDGGHLLA